MFITDDTSCRLDDINRW